METVETGPKWIVQASRRTGKTAASVDAMRRHLAELPVIRVTSEPRQPPGPKRPWLTRQPQDYPAKADCTVEGELRRLRALGPKTCSRWWSPLRAELIAEGLIAPVMGVDGLWAGDQITRKGRALL